MKVIKLLNLSNYRYFLFILLILTYIPLFSYFRELNLNGGHSFLTADWLINYKFGFANRGLIGTLIVSLSKSGTTLLNIITYSLIFFYILIFYFLQKTFNNKNQNLISYFLIFSPLAFLFPIYDSQGSFRKEILGILALFILTSSIKSKNYNLSLYASSIIYTIGIFSHSVNLFFLSTILFILYNFQKTKKYFDYILYILPSAFYILINLFLRPTEQKLTIIKNELCSYMYDLELENLCGYGSFDFITWDLNAHYLISQNYIINLNRDVYLFYIVLFLFSLVPYLFDKQAFQLFKMFLPLFVTFVPLFLIAIDWGRWLYIMSLCLLSIYLLSDKNIISSRLKYLLFLYPVAFRAEHCCNINFEFSFEYFLNNISYLFANFLSVIKLI